jgi:ectoine hydroxylase-related dioxygenase (phytanoyl-CoA dioxygenase family)
MTGRPELRCWKHATDRSPVQRCKNDGVEAPEPESINAAVDAFQRDGATVLRRALGSDWLDLLAEGVEYNRTHPSNWSHWYTSSDEAVGFWSDYVTWPEVEQYQRVAFNSGLAEIAGQLMESTSVRFFHEHVLVKEPGATERTPWHHDDPYYCIDGNQNVSMWIALDPVPASSGLQFIAGSHLWDQRFIPRQFIDHAPYGQPDERFELLPDIETCLEQETILSWDVEPGDILAFHYRTLHGAPGNDLPTRRRAVSLRWVGDDATFASRPWVTSPPYEANGLIVGGSLDGDARFPLVVG